MDLISGILANQAPAKQTANATIVTLCDRLAHGTLLEDRRAAVQGLRSFAREYKETVASEGLRGLISTLAKDIEDIDTVKVVLETLLMLFVKDEANPDSSDDIALWLADEFTQKQNNINLLVELLDNSDFYARLYTLQLLAAVVKNRPERTKESIFTAPLGITRLVSVLDDTRDIVRNEGVLLLALLTDQHSNIQKVVAFENAFERIFGIIRNEGGVDGGVAVQDCLNLLSKLLTFNASNQTFFRETSCIPQLVTLLTIEEEATGYSKDIRTVNICLTLDICGLFVVPNSSGTLKNQLTFWQTGITIKVLNLAFSKVIDEIVRAKVFLQKYYGVLKLRKQALTILSDMIRSNSELQKNFAQLQVDDLNASGLGIEGATGANKIYVIEGLLDLALLISPKISFPGRLAAGRCIEGYFHDNEPIKLHFLHRAIDGFSSGVDETANILTSLMELDSDSRADPYRTWLSAVIFLHLINEDEEVKQLAMKLSSGNTESGEEVVTAVQSFSANLISSIQHRLDQRISIAFYMILSIWLYDDTAAVNDFLEEGSTLQSLVGIVAQSSTPDIIIQGLGAFLLGIIYEFSSESSPVPRAKLYTILSGIGRDQYVYKMGLLRKHPWVRDFELEGEVQHTSSASAQVYFHATFVDFLKDNFSRILRTIDKDPGDPQTNGVQKNNQSVSMEMFESIKAQLESKEEELVKCQTFLLNVEHDLSQEQEELRQVKESSHATVQKVKEMAAREIANARDEKDNIIDQFDADLALERENHLSFVRKLEVDRDERIRMAEANKEQLVGEHEATTREWRIERDETTRAMEILSKDATTNLSTIERMEKDREDAAKFADSIIKQSAEHENAKMLLQDELANLQKEYDTERVNHQKRIVEHLEELSQLSEEHEKLVDTRNKELSSQAEDLTAKLKFSQERANEAENRADVLDTQLQTVEEKFQAKIVNLTSKITDLNKNIDDLRAELQAAKDKASELEGKYRSQEKNMRETEEKLRMAEARAIEVEKKVQDNKETTTRLKDLEEKTSKLQAELVEATSKSATAQTERDDLMLVMGDLEEKARDYKNRLKKLNQEVSSDEEDEDENEDEDEDEAEDDADPHDDDVE